MVITAVGIDNIRGPLLSGGGNKARRINLGPNSALTIEGSSGGGCLGNVDLDGAVVATSEGVLAGALVVLVPFEAIKRSAS